MQAIGDRCDIEHDIDDWEGCFACPTVGRIKLGPMILLLSLDKVLFKNTYRTRRVIITVVTLIQ